LIAVCRGSRDELGPVDLDELALRQQAERAVDAGDEPRHRRLARAGVAEEHQVPGDGRAAQAGGGAHLLDAQQLGLPVDLALDRHESGEVVELGEQLLEGLRRMLGLGLGGGLRRLLGAGCPAGCGTWGRPVPPTAASVIGEGGRTPAAAS
jgi:hypothetical protein